MNSRLSNQLNQTMLRVKDPIKSIKFYEKYFNMTMAHQKTFSDFSLYFLVNKIALDRKDRFDPSSTEAADFIHSGNYGVTLELTHNHGTEKDSDFSYHNGNSDPLGFANVGFLVNDMKSVCDTMVEDGLKVVPSTITNTNAIGSTMCVADPDGYLVEILQRQNRSICENKPTLTNIKSSTFHHTTLRVKDIKKSIEFYQDLWGMTLIAKIDPSNTNDGTITYYLASLPSSETSKVALLGNDMSYNYLMSHTGTVLALQQTQGTENISDFHYDSGNNEPKRGFGHIAFMVDDVYETCDLLESKGCLFKKKPNDGRMKGLAFVFDPDGYWVEIVRRNGRISNNI